MFNYDVAGIPGTGNYNPTGFNVNNGLGTQTLFQGNVVEIDILQQANTTTLTSAQLNSVPPYTVGSSSQISQGDVNAILPTTLGAFSDTRYAVVDNDGYGARGFGPGNFSSPAWTPVRFIGQAFIQINPAMSQVLTITGSATGGSLIFAYTNSLGTQGFGTASLSNTTLTMISNLTAAVGGITGIGTNAVSITNVGTASYTFTFSPAVANANLLTISGQGLTGTTPAGTMGLNTSFVTPGTLLSPVPGQTYASPTISPYQQQNVSIPVSSTSFTLVVSNSGATATSGPITYSAVPATMAQNITAALNGLAVGGAGSQGGGTLSGVTATAASTSSGNILVSFPYLFQRIGLMQLGTISGNTLGVVNVSSASPAYSSLRCIAKALDNLGNASVANGVVSPATISTTTGNPGLQQNAAPATDPYVTAYNSANSVSISNSLGYESPQFTIWAQLLCEDGFGYRLSVI